MGLDDEILSNIAAKSEISLAPQRTLTSAEDISDRSKRILETLEKAIEAYTQARIHLSNVAVEEAKIADANYNQETIAREMLAQGDQFIDVIKADPRHELGLDVLSDLALTHIQSYNTGLETMAHKCDILDSDITELTRLIATCQVKYTPAPVATNAPAKSENRLRQIPTLRAQYKAKREFLDAMSQRSHKIRRRSVAPSTSESVYSEESSQRGIHADIAGKKVMIEIPRQALAARQPLSPLRAPQSLTDIFTYVIAQK